MKVAARPDVGTNSTVITALGKIGPAAKDALPLLSSAVQSPDPEIRRAAAVAIAAIAKKWPGSIWSDGG
jgi:HEAT repeat protein